MTPLIFDRNTASLDQSVRDKWNALNFDDCEFYACDHELLWYGVDGMVHVFLMQEALKVSSGAMSAEDFVQKYKVGINLPDNPWSSLAVPFKTIHSAGIFIPKLSWKKHEVPARNERGIVTPMIPTRVRLFSMDYMNYVTHDSMDAEDDTRKEDWFKAITLRDWSANDFNNETLIRDGLLLGKKLWQGALQGYEKHKLEEMYSYELGESKYLEVVNLCEDLIKYYQEAVIDIDV